MNDGAHQRIGDIERSQALDRLGPYFADGYLDIDEFDTRTGAAVIARTAGEIDVLFTDLPEQQASTAVTPVQDDTEKELDLVLQRGKKLKQIDSAIWAVVMVSFFLGLFVFNVPYFWVVFILGGAASAGARFLLKVDDADEKLFEELHSKEQSEREARLRIAAQRRRELEQ
ncbi:DUF1707 domain-containing protein [Corynebacterium glutamicum]|uniref:DUF1707 SHOCT-like domain-containing protein n=1 Tax=Corynebacterium TaxID=1716 RepID=UPI00071EBDFE|nr:MULTISPECIES: DUF1707 domain-containing protein [Corynebacterium]ALP50143.1 hypothetical protein AC079_08005 [Corynebacterium glutamicum]ANR62537.1 hypothetical protein C628_07950 [[Brevibacterium] flavum ZL-1]ANR65538.1 hypothetical protein C627_07865 [Corynebacterium glutamicum ZL-6]ANU33660.1 hypothetical protein BBD29_07800 [Corynebacterium glutamicum]APT07407.1 hypothetical protein BSP99_08040 [Corynebacterium glutamicum]